MDITQLKDYCKDDEIKYNLSLRSKNKPASQFEYNNPLEADGVPILARPRSTEADPNIKVTYNTFATIQRTKAGYMGSSIIREYGDDISEDVKAKYKTFDNLNNTKTLFKKMMFSCAGWGNTFSLCYIDKKTYQVRMKQIPAWQAKVIYDDNNEPIQGFVYYKEGDNYIVYEYDDLLVTKYRKMKTSDNYEVLEPASLHGFQYMPLIEWKNNDNEQGNAQTAISLLDAYDLLMSDNITEWATFRTAYLMLKNAGFFDDEKKATLRKTGIFTLDGENSEVKFVTKDVNPEFVKFITSEAWSGIWVVASSVDPKALASLSNATAFQISQLYRNMEEDCKDTELEWGQSMEYLDRVLMSYWTGLDTKSVQTYSTEDITYTFDRSLPKDIVTWLKDMLAAGAKLSQKEILTKAGYTEAESEVIIEDYQNESYEEMPVEEPIEDNV